MVGAEIPLNDRSARQSYPPFLSVAPLFRFWTMRSAVREAAAGETELHQRCSSLDIETKPVLA